MIEHVDDERTALFNINKVLAPSGRAFILVRNFGTLDHVLGHRRRYTRQSLAELAAECGFAVSSMIEFNRVGSLAWFVNGKILQRRTFGIGQIWLWLLNLMTPVFRRLDKMLPLPPLSLIAVLERRSAQSQETGTCVPSPDAALLA